MQYLRIKVAPWRRQVNRAGRAAPLLGRIGLVALFSVGSALAGCYPKAGPPPGVVSAQTAAAASARWPGVTASTLATGHDLFLAKCDGCHHYPDLTAISDERWPGIVETMGKKSHLGAEERDEVLHYILAARSDPAGT